MPIPYDSSLTLMSVVNQDALKSVEAIAELQAHVDAAQDALNSLISSKRSLTMTKTELKHLGAGTDALDEELKKLNVAVEAAVGAYATAKMAAEPQITENKILDVNSMMTALDDYLKKAADGKADIFKTAWQKFFLAERDLNGTDEDITGTLNILCNDFPKPILWDTENTSNSFGTFVIEFTDKDLEFMKEEGFYSKSYIKSRKDTLILEEDKKQMLVLARDFPFIVYSIQYELPADFQSRIFPVEKNEKMKCFVPFFPFRRPFYHRAEAILDDLVFKELMVKQRKNQR
ncbi:hypothetical protein FOBRF1_004248 [Fusarium oxysporum]